MTDADPPLRFDITPKICNVGDEVTVCFNLPSAAGTTVTIDINDGTTIGPTDTLQITLDESGKGCATWTAPNWVSGTAIFTHFDSQDEGIAIDP